MTNTVMEPGDTRDSSQEDPLEEGMATHSSIHFLPGESHGQRSLVGCGPWGREESDMTEWLHFHFLLSCIGEGNGNPLQYSCLENPVDRGAWWAAVYGVAQSQTQLKWLSMHACIGEGNGNPLQYSRLENPRDRGAWWAAVFGVTQGRTRLKWLSSSRTLQSMEFSRAEYWSEYPFPSPGDLPKPEVEPVSPAFRWILYHLSR